MKSSTAIVKYTPAVLKAVCKQQGITKKQLRFNTLKRVGVELAIVLEGSTLDDADRAVLTDLYDAVRLALGDE